MTNTKRLMIATISALLAPYLWGSAVAAQNYDGRGDENCNDLRQQVIKAEEKLRNAKAKARAIQNKKAFWSNMNRSNQKYQNALSGVWSTQVNDSNDEVEFAADQLRIARHDYDMNGCTAGGQTVYEHTYPH